jgi:hypothetical protein
VQKRRITQKETKMLFKTYRVVQLMNQYDELSEIEKIIARKVVLSLIENEKEFSINCNEFYDEEGFTVHPYEVMESMENLNMRLSYIYKYALHVFDTDDWYIACDMNAKPFNSLSVHMD